jgi:hypothetical protein
MGGITTRLQSAEYREAAANMTRLACACPCTERACSIDNTSGQRKYYNAHAQFQPTEDSTIYITEMAASFSRASRRCISVDCLFGSLKPRDKRLPK